MCVTIEHTQEFSHPMSSSSVKRRAVDALTPRSADEVKQLCRDRLTSLGILPGISNRKLMGILRKLEDRPIKIIHGGVNDHVEGLSRGMSGLIKRDARLNKTVIKIANSPRTQRGRHVLRHEQSHIIVQPRTGVTTYDGAPVDGVQFRCGCTNDVEREVEMTAHLLAEYMDSQLPDEQPISSVLGLGLSLASARAEADQ